MYILKTERLNFRRMDQDDIENLMKIFSDPVAMQYYPSTFPRIAGEKWIEMNLEFYITHGFGLWICELHDGTFVGQCGLVPQVVDGVEEVEIGYLFVREHWGKGLATEAALCVLDYAFSSLKLNRLVATIYHKNVPSIKLAERIGMEYEKRTFVGTSDDVIYSIQKKRCI